MEDGKREMAVSLLPLVPDDRDSGRTYTCRVLNPAAPAGRQTSITINVQRKCSKDSLQNQIKPQKKVLCVAFGIRRNMEPFCL